MPTQYNDSSDDQDIDLTLKEGEYQSQQEEKRIIKALISKYYGVNKLENCAKYGKLDEKKFLISSQWWRSWCQYVNFDKEEEESSGSNTNRHDQPGAKSAYPRPGIITNHVLQNSHLDQGKIVKSLKPDLLEHFDYEALPSKIYNVLKSWYGCDNDIIRYLRRDPIIRDQLFLDMYYGKNIKKLNLNFFW